MTPEVRAMNVRLAATAETVAVWIAERSLPDIANVEIRHSRSVETIIAVCQIAATVDDFAALVTCATALDEATVTTSRREGPNGFVSVAITGDVSDIPVTFWTHLESADASALWNALGWTPNPDVAVLTTVDVLRVAAESTSERAA